MRRPRAQRPSPPGPGRRCLPGRLHRAFPRSCSASRPAILLAQAQGGELVRAGYSPAPAAASRRIAASKTSAVPRSRAAPCADHAPSRADRNAAAASSLKRSAACVAVAASAVDPSASPVLAATRSRLFCLSAFTCEARRRKSAVSASSGMAPRTRHPNCRAWRERRERLLELPRRPVSVAARRARSAAESSRRASVSRAFSDAIAAAPRSSARGGSSRDAR